MSCATSSGWETIASDPLQTLRGQPGQDGVGDFAATDQPHSSIRQPPGRRDTSQAHSNRSKEPCPRTATRVLGCNLEQPGQKRPLLQESAASYNQSSIPTSRPAPPRDCAPQATQTQSRWSRVTAGAPSTALGRLTRSSLRRARGTWHRPGDHNSLRAGRSWCLFACMAAGPGPSPGGGLLALSALLIAVTIWLVHRRAA